MTQPIQAVFLLQIIPLPESEKRRLHGPDIHAERFRDLLVTDSVGLVDYEDIHFQVQSVEGAQRTPLNLEDPVTRYVHTTKCVTYDGCAGADSCA